MKATIIYYSRTGTTATFANALAMYLWQKGISVSLMSQADYKPEKVEQADLLFLGCWTSGWFVINQHPHVKWKIFAQQLPEDLKAKLFLFTTYKFRTGSMFRNMRKHLPRGLKEQPLRTLQARIPHLNAVHKQQIDAYLAEIAQI